MVLKIDELKIVKSEELNTLTRRQLFEYLNSQRPENSKCAANRPYFNNAGELIAVRCNCGKKVYHPIYGVIVDWNNKPSPSMMSKVRNLKVEAALWLFEE